MFWNCFTYCLIPIHCHRIPHFFSLFPLTSTLKYFLFHHHPSVLLFYGVFSHQHLQLFLMICLNLLLFQWFLSFWLSFERNLLFIRYFASSLLICSFDNIYPSFFIYFQNYFIALPIGFYFLSSPFPTFKTESMIWKSSIHLVDVRLRRKVIYNQWT